MAVHGSGTHRADAAVQATGCLIVALRQKRPVEEWRKALTAGFPPDVETRLKIESDQGSHLRFRLRGLWHEKEIFNRLEEINFEECSTGTGSFRTAYFDSGYKGLAALYAWNLAQMAQAQLGLQAQSIYAAGERGGYVWARDGYLFEPDFRVPYAQGRFRDNLEVVRAGLSKIDYEFAQDTISDLVRDPQALWRLADDRSLIDAAALSLYGEEARRFGKLQDHYGEVPLGAQIMIGSSWDGRLEYRGHQQTRRLEAAAKSAVAHNENAYARKTLRVKAA